MFVYTKSQPWVAATTGTAVRVGTRYLLYSMVTATSAAKFCVTGTGPQQYRASNRALPSMALLKGVRSAFLAFSSKFLSLQRLLLRVTNRKRSSYNSLLYHL